MPCSLEVSGRITGLLYIYFFFIFLFHVIRGQGQGEVLEKKVSDKSCWFCCVV